MQVYISLRIFITTIFFVDRLTPRAPVVEYTLSHTHTHTHTLCLPMLSTHFLHPLSLPSSHFQHSLFLPPTFLESLGRLSIQFPPGPFSKYFSVREALSSMWAGGIPNTSTILQTWSNSSLPLKRGSPVCISTSIHPRLHMSIAR